MNLKEEVQDIFRDVFDDDELVIAEDMTADDIPDWNSLTHMELLCAIEENFQFKFNSREIRKFKDIGDLLKTIERKLKA